MWLKLHCDIEMAQSSIRVFYRGEKHKGQGQVQDSNEAPSVKQAKPFKRTNKSKLDSEVANSSKCIPKSGRGKTWQVKIFIEDWYDEFPWMDRESVKV